MNMITKIKNLFNDPVNASNPVIIALKDLNLNKDDM